MDKKILRTANYFRKRLKGKIELNNIIPLIEKKGYRIVFFNTGKGDATVKAYNLEEHAKASRAFTYVSGNDRIVFIDNDIGIDEKRRALLHEAGHIELGHFGNIHMSDKQQMEAEAYAFMLEVLTPTEHALYTPLAFVIAVVCVISGYAAHSVITPEQAVVSVTEISSDADYVYITRAGTKYHTQNCGYIKNKDCARIEREQADRLFLPCDVCNP